MLKYVFLLALIIQTFSITFPLVSNRQTCLYIKQSGLYQLQYIISGQTPSKYTCTIHSGPQVIQTISQATQYQKSIYFTTDNNKICFSSLDDQMKQASFDIIATSDPLKDHFSVKDEEETHLKMFAAFQELQKVYRDQNMFVQRNVIYQNVLFNKEVKIVFVLLFKILIAIVLGAYQLFLVKEIITKNTSIFIPPPGIRGDDSDSDEQMK